jgi:hypothetical protein
MLLYSPSEAMSGLSGSICQGFSHLRFAETTYLAPVPCEINENGIKTVFLEISNVLMQKLKHIGCAVFSREPGGRNYHMVRSAKGRGRACHRRDNVPFSIFAYSADQPTLSRKCRGLLRGSFAR